MNNAISRLAAVIGPWRQRQGRVNYEPKYPEHFDPLNPEGAAIYPGNDIPPWMESKTGIEPWAIGTDRFPEPGIGTPGMVTSPGEFQNGTPMGDMINNMTPEQSQAAANAFEGAMQRHGPDYSDPSSAPEPLVEPPTEAPQAGILPVLGPIMHAITNEGRHAFPQFPRGPDPVSGTAKPVASWEQGTQGAETQDSGASWANGVRGAETPLPPVAPQTSGMSWTPVFGSGTPLPPANNGGNGGYGNQGGYGNGSGGSGSGGYDGNADGGYGGGDIGLGPGDIDQILEYLGIGGGSGNPGGLLGSGPPVEMN